MDAVAKHELPIAFFTDETFTEKVDFSYSFYFYKIQQKTHSILDSRM